MGIRGDPRGLNHWSGFIRRAFADGFLMRDKAQTLKSSAGFAGSAAPIPQIIPLPMSGRSSGGTNFGDATLSQSNVAAISGLCLSKP